MSLVHISTFTLWLCLSFVDCVCVGGGGVLCSRALRQCSENVPAPLLTAAHFSIFGPQRGVEPETPWISAQTELLLPCFSIKIWFFFLSTPTTKKNVAAPWWSYILRTNANDPRLQILPNVVSDARVRCRGSLLVFIVALNSRHTCYSTTNLFISPAAHLSVVGCLCQQDTDVKDRLLHKRRLKCDYNQMCMQIISEAVDFAVSHRCMLSETLFTFCCQETIKNLFFLPAGQIKPSTIWWKVLDGMIAGEREA